MATRRFRRLHRVALRLGAALTSAAEPPYYQADFAPREFAERRRRVADEIGSDAAAVLRGGISTGAFDIFRQTNEFYYLSGVEVPHACLLIEGGTGRATLYLPPGDPHAAASEGRELTSDDPAEAAAVTGMDDVRPLEALAGDLSGISTLYTPLSPGEGRMQCRDTLRQARKMREADPWEDGDSGGGHSGPLADSGRHAAH
jgi:Xaa-Pro aminopeptidase